jgi:hypothetical protein
MGKSINLYEAKPQLSQVVEPASIHSWLRPATRAALLRDPDREESQSS